MNRNPTMHNLDSAVDISEGKCFDNDSGQYRLDVLFCHHNAYAVIIMLVSCVIPFCHEFIYHNKSHFFFAIIVYAKQSFTERYRTNFIYTVK